MIGFLNKANQMIEDANLSIKNYNKLIKEYEDKGFFGKFFSEDPETQERKINSKKGVIDSVNEKKKSYPAELKKVKIKIHEIEKKHLKVKKLFLVKILKRKVNLFRFF